MKNCANCQTSFTIHPEDRLFYEKIEVPEPRLCPDCRQQRRLAWRNERSIYKRKCNLTNKDTLSFYPPESKYKVYSQKAWWTDAWDGKRYGRDFDFNRSFFEQFEELINEVPHMAMVVSHGENSDYCPYSVNYKDCYMCISGVVGEKIYYSFWTNESKSCMDCYACFRCEQCYECVECTNVYQSIFSKDCKNSNDLAFCINCDHCKNCIGCYGLRHKEYYVFNKKVSPDEFKKIKREISQSTKSLADTLKKLKKHVRNYPCEAVQMTNTENCTGDYLLSCKNSHDCYLSENLEDCAYLWNVPGGAKDCMDANYSPHSELVYNGMSNVNCYACISCAYCWDIKNTYYSFQCFYSNELFGCIGLKHQKYCILNKQYTKEEYEALVPKIIKHMSDVKSDSELASEKKTGEYGEYFPVNLSPFTYNETIAQDFFPMKRDEVLQKDWKWNDKPEPILKVSKTIPANRLPDNIKDIPDDILNWAILCKETGKPFKIIEQELKFYREMNLPIPHLHPNIRHLNRQKWLNPRRLWNRACHQCQKEIQTTYSPEQPEKVYCEHCYLKEIYYLPIESRSSSDIQ